MKKIHNWEIWRINILHREKKKKYLSYINLWFDYLILLYSSYKNFCNSLISKVKKKIKKRLNKNHSPTIHHKSYTCSSSINQIKKTYNILKTKQERTRFRKLYQNIAYTRSNWSLRLSLFFKLGWNILKIMYKLALINLSSNVNYLFSL